MNKLLILPLLFFCNLIFSQIPNLCGEKIIVEVYKSTSEEANKNSEIVAEMLKSILITNSNKLEYISNDKLGDLEYIIDRENQIQGLSQSYSQSLFRRDITYITFISSSEVYFSSLKSNTSKIVFYDTWTRNPDIEIEISYTIDEIEKAALTIVKERLDEKIQEKLDCDKIDEEVGRLKKDVQKGEEDLEKIINNQEYDCTELIDLLRNEAVMSKVEKKYNSIYKFLLSQKENCEDLIGVNEFLETKRRDLKDANIEKEKQELLAFQEEQRRRDLKEREDKVEKEQRKIDEQKRLDIGNETTLPCLNSLPYYEVSMQDFKSRFNKEYFVQFAVLPLKYYKPCDLKNLYEIRRNTPSKLGPYIYLVNRGRNFSEGVRLQGVIGPFQTIGEANSFLLKVQRVYDSKSIVITP